MENCSSPHRYISGDDECAQAVASQGSVGREIIQLVGIATGGMYKQRADMVLALSFLPLFEAYGNNVEFYELRMNDTLIPIYASIRN